MQEQAALANRHTPVLQTHDRYGHRIDRVDFHPAWHQLMTAGVSAGLHCSPWADPRPGAHVARAAAFLLHAEVENGTLCPLSMTYGSASSLAQAPELESRWLPAICSRQYDPAPSRASAALAWLVGEEGRGIPTILQMGVFTRLDCSLGSAGIMHQCVAQAVHHARHRRAFGRALIEQPLMRNVLADLALEVEGAVALSMRLARAYDCTGDDVEIELRRVLTGVCKYWICRRGPPLAFEAMEALGGNGYVEEAPLARFYRELPVNSIWEGSGNVMCLDVMRAFSRSPAAAEAVARLLQRARGCNPLYDAFCKQLLARLRPKLSQEQFEWQARRLTSDVALAVTASILLQACGEIGDVFCRSRLDGPAGVGMTFGNLPDHPALATLIERALPGIG